MAQYKDGSVSVTSNSPTVVGTDVDWSTINVGDIFLVVGHNAEYTINAIDTVNDTITLATVFGGLSHPAKPYAISGDFTPNFRLPLMTRGDVETATIFTRAMTEIDKWIGVQTSQSPLTVLASSGTTATATLVSHGLWTGALVTITGATPTGYNGTFIITVTDEDIFTYTLPSSQDAITVLPNVSFRSAVSLGRVHTQAGHNFKIGSVLIYGTNGFELAKSTGAATYSYVVGIVSSVTGSSFTLASQGLVVGIPGIGTPASGTVYYLKNAASPENLSITEPSGIERKVPIFIAQGYINSGGTNYTYGHIVNFPIGQTTEMTGATLSDAGAAGAAPAPVAGDEVKFLRGDKSWAFPIPDIGSITTKFLKATKGFSSSAWNILRTNPESSEDSPIGALLDLDSRVTSLLSGGLGGPRKTFDISPTWNADPDHSHGGRLYVDKPVRKYYWVCPAGVTTIKVEMWGAGGGSNKASIRFGGVGCPVNTGSGGGGGGAYGSGPLEVEEGVVYEIGVGISPCFGYFVAKPLPPNPHEPYYYPSSTEASNSGSGISHAGGSYIKIKDGVTKLSVGGGYSATGEWGWYNPDSYSIPVDWRDGGPTGGLGAGKPSGFVTQYAGENGQDGDLSVPIEKRCSGGGNPSIPNAGGQAMISTADQLIVSVQNKYSVSATGGNWQWLIPPRVSGGAPGECRTEFVSRGCTGTKYKDSSAWFLGTRYIGGGGSYGIYATDSQVPVMAGHGGDGLVLLYY